MSGGDIGGANVLLPMILYFESENIPSMVVDHGYLSRVLSEYRLKNVDMIPPCDETLKNIFTSNQVGAYLFATGGWDTFPLTLARKAKDFSIPVMYLLDSWVNYRVRMELDGMPTFHPDVYAVMDRVAFEAARKDGIPEKSLSITGQPALWTLANEWLHWKSKNDASHGGAANPRLNNLEKTVVFVSEPVENDHGTTGESFLFRGYTEKEVIKLLCSELGDYAEKIRVRILPHPRDDIEKLNQYWGMFKGRLEGNILGTSNGREAIYAADGVCGMASILLYEAWLIGKPVLSIQPGALRSDLYFLKNKTGCHFISDNESDISVFDDWIDEIKGKPVDTNARQSELIQHENATRNVFFQLQRFLQ